jgi:hypothetical protein
MGLRRNKVLSDPGIPAQGHGSARESPVLSLSSLVFLSDPTVA